MIKVFNYFFQSLIIYFFFIIGRILGIKLSRKIFSYLFSIIGPLFRSKQTIKKNLNIFSETISDQEREVIIKNMLRNPTNNFIL